jgi:hypothetical protein
VDLRRLQRLFERRLREDRRQPAGEHGLTGAWRADHEQVVRARRGDLQRALGMLLAAHLGEIRRLLQGASK